MSKLQPSTKADQLHGYLCARLEWRDVPDEMQQRYEVPPSMIVRDLASLQHVPQVSEA